MGKVAVVYWSGTGNTEEMAKAVLEGAKKGGADAELFTVSDFGADKMAGYNGFLFGCPAMGDEVLEEDEFEPFFTEAEKNLSGVPVGLFGSYGWGTGDWMETWKQRVIDAGANLIGTAIVNETPNDSEECKALGEAAAKA